MGTSPFKLVVCCKKYEKEDRERNTLYDHEVIKVFKQLTQCIESKAAVVMLEHMKKCWRTSSQDIFDIHSWTVVIHNLVSSISEDDEVASAFKQKYPDLLCLGPVYSMTMRNRRMQARNWLSLQKKHYILVNESFRALGYHTLERMCEINGGFTVEDRPAEKDDKCFEIIEELILKIYKSFFMLDKKIPERKIIVNTKAVCHGMVKLNSRKTKIVNEDGLKIKDEPTEIYLKKDIFRKEGFYDALSTYIHEMCHMFGGDSSQNFSLALTLAMEKLLMNTEEVERAWEEWQKVVS